jgi:hypothetical protein
MAKRAKPPVDENDFEALDRLAHSITLENTRPLNARERKQWAEAKHGRPRKAPGAKSVPTLITVEPTLLRRIDAYVKKAGISRSRLFAEAVRERIGAARPKRKAG